MINPIYQTTKYSGFQFVGVTDTKTGDWHFIGGVKEIRPETFFSPKVVFDSGRSDEKTLIGVCIKNNVTPPDFYTVDYVGAKSSVFYMFWNDGFYEYIEFNCEELNASFRKNKRYTKEEILGSFPNLSCRFYLSPLFKKGKHHETNHTS